MFKTALNLLSHCALSPGEQEAYKTRSGEHEAQEPVEAVISVEFPHLIGYLHLFFFSFFSESSPFSITLSYFRMSLEGISRSWLGLCGVHRIISLRACLVIGFR